MTSDRGPSRVHTEMHTRPTHSTGGRHFPTRRGETDDDSGRGPTVSGRHPRLPRRDLGPRGIERRWSGPADELPVLNSISESAVSLRERLGLTPNVMRWRIYTDMTPRFAGRGFSALIVRTTEVEPWERAASRRGLTGAPREDWPLEPIADPVREQPVYSFISCTLRQAADRTGVSEATLSDAIADGYLTAHRAGDKGGRIVLRAQETSGFSRSPPKAPRSASGRGDTSE